MIAVTRDGYEILTEGLPYTADEIERAVKGNIVADAILASPWSSRAQRGTPLVGRAAPQMSTVPPKGVPRRSRSSG